MVDENSLSVQTMSVEDVFVDDLWQTSSHGEPGDVRRPSTAEVKQFSTMTAKTQIVVDRGPWPSILIEDRPQSIAPGKARQVESKLIPPAAKYQLVDCPH